MVSLVVLSHYIKLPNKIFFLFTGTYQKSHNNLCVAFGKYDEDS